MLNSIVLLVDLSAVPASFECCSLFVNGKHILDEDGASAESAQDIGLRIANSLGVPLVETALNEVDLARYIAGSRNESDVFEADLKGGVIEFGDWVEGYTSEDVLKAVELMDGRSYTSAMQSEMYTLPDGLVTANASAAAEQWAEAFYQAKDALMRVRPVPELLVRSQSVKDLDEVLLQCDSVISLGDKLGF